jgi:peptidase M23-like protein
MRQLAAIVLTATAASPAGAGLRAADAPSPDWTWPVRGKVITPYRNGGDPYARGQHRGVDIAAERGAEVVAATAGTVRFAGPVGSAGLTVSVRTADGRFDASYLHLSSIVVARGEAVRAGERIGAVGTTGRRSAERPHLHFGVREAGRRHAYRDPLDFLPQPAPAPRPAPPPAPVSAPAPAPVRPAPAPVPRAEPVPRLVPMPRAAPRHAPRPTPAAHLTPRTRPVRAPRRARAPVGGGAPLAHRPPAPHRARPGYRPASHTPVVVADERAAAPHRSKPASPTAPAPARANRRGGLDLGWLAACIGCVLAAVALGRPARAAGGSGRRLGLVESLRLLTGRG